ncbi:hypothetical protein LPA45_09890 [Cupriavidus sp. Agwp_2]
MPPTPPFASTVPVEPNQVSPPVPPLVGVVEPALPPAPMLIETEPEPDQFAIRE